MSKKQRRYGLAKVEFLACKPEIEKLLSEGHSIVLAYDKLKAAGKIKTNMSYKLFSHYIRTGVAIRQMERDRKVFRQDIQRKSAPPSPSPKIPSPDTPGFHHNPRITKEMERELVGHVEPQKIYPDQFIWDPDKELL